jgi:hypothetical protein
MVKIIAIIVIKLKMKSFIGTEISRSDEGSDRDSDSKNKPARSPRERINCTDFVILDAHRRKDKPCYLYLH